MHEELGVSKDVCSEPRTGSSANAKFATGEAHDGDCVQGDSIQVLEYGEYCSVPENMKAKRACVHPYLW